MTITIDPSKRYFCKECNDLVEVIELEGGGPGDVYCLLCGYEYNLSEAIYRHYACGVVKSVEAIPKSDLKKTTVDVGSGSILQVVTNAKYISENDVVVVAMEGAIVPAGADPEEDSEAIVVSKKPVGGVKSEGMYCDSTMLGWAGGAKGVLQKLDASFTPGQCPPLERPRNS